MVSDHRAEHTLDAVLRLLGLDGLGGELLGGRIGHRRETRLDDLVGHQRVAHREHQDFGGRKLVELRHELAAQLQAV